MLLNSHVFIIYVYYVVTHILGFCYNTSIYGRNFLNRAIWENKIPVECLQTSHLSVFISWRNVIEKLFRETACFFYKYWKQLLIKRLLVKKLLSILHRLQIKYYHYILRNPKKPWKMLKPWLSRKVHVQLYSIFLFCFIITTQLPSTRLTSELQFLPVSEMGIFYIVALNFKDWLFGVTVIRHFRPKSGNFSESIYCKPIARTLKMLFSERSCSFLGLWFLSYGSYWFVN